MDKVYLVYGFDCNEMCDCYCSHEDSYVDSVWTDKDKAEERKKEFYLGEVKEFEVNKIMGDY